MAIVAKMPCAAINLTLSGPEKTGRLYDALGRRNFSTARSLGRLRVGSGLLVSMCFLPCRPKIAEPGGRV